MLIEERCASVQQSGDSLSPWWERLPEDFWRQADSTELDPRHPLKIHGTAAIERVMRTALSTTVAASALATLSRPGRLQREFEALSFYEPLARAADASRVFLPPPKDIVITQRELPGKDIRRLQLRFASPFKPLNPYARPQFESMQRNAYAHAQHWCHGDRPRPTLIVIHGFAADPHWINAHVLSLAGFYRRGYDVLLFTFPHHGPRAERGNWFSGQGLFGSGLAAFNEAPLHAIHDLRVFISYLQGRGVEQIGVTGISLGGYTAALLAAVDERLAWCVPIVPAVSPIDAFLEWQPTGLLLSRLMRSQGIGVAQMRGLLAVHNPLTYAPCLDGERMLVIGGAGDRVTLPRHVRLLHQHWPGSEMHWFAGNHILHLGRREYLARMGQLMDRYAGAL
ncbi:MULTISPECIES: alpha/beta hydrolase family protein [Pseudomonas]|uniref:alpha/beta hydrolase family protein n=1 Tax=Pseudomonas TaxID=286 RepID=UPI00200A3998|nr:alpha/beta hydrolase family protein [Pseudomonas sp. V98_8]MCK8682889.1 alpha/beta hydrolase family protein [Pseudomonas umsongensis]MDI3393521.1 alpha/beta hydrolase family protein [Pseudomonas sp. V98_8]